MSTTINVKKYHTIVIEGIDKTCKDLISKYLFELDKGKYLHITRGIMSCIAYNYLYEREYRYELSQHKNEVFFLINTDKEDWEIRCKLSNEPKINFEENVLAFEYASEKLRKSGCLVYQFNVSSNNSIYLIAKNILKIMEDFN